MEVQPKVNLDLFDQQQNATVREGPAQADYLSQINYEFPATVFGNDAEEIQRADEPQQLAPSCGSGGLPFKPKQKAQENGGNGQQEEFLREETVEMEQTVKTDLSQ